MMLSPYAQDAGAINLANIRMIQVEVLLVIYQRKNGTKFVLGRRFD